MGEQGRRHTPVALAEVIADRLDGRQLACAESFTAGRVASAFASVEGASDWFRGGVIGYQSEVKRALLSVQADVVVSAQAATEMALGVSELLESEVAVATTGVAGAPQDGVAPGTVFIGTSVDGEVRGRELHLNGDADEVCDAGALAALEALADHLRCRT
jgi:PncC family amidohydrolase